MTTIFERVDDSKSLYQSLNSSFLINNQSSASGNYKFAGLYAIFKDDVCYYVGQSQNLASRLTQHLTGKYKNANKVFVIMADDQVWGFYLRDKEIRKQILENNEMFLMSKLKPIENLVTPRDDYELKESHRFECLLDFNIETIENDGPTQYLAEMASAFIDLNDSTIVVSNSSDVHLDKSSAFDDYIKYIIDTTVHLGSSQAKKEFCHG